MSLAVENAGVRRASVYSAEGTLAHAVAQARIESGVPLAFFLGQTRSVDGFTFTIDQEFLDHVAVYTDHIETLIGLGYLVTLEQRVDPAVQWPDLYPLPIPLWGTSDCIAYHPGTGQLHIIDLKFGMGLVEPEDNPQLLYYAAGSCHPVVLNATLPILALPDDRLPNDVTLTVVQPRLGHPDGRVRSWPTSGLAVRDWARDVLYPGVVLAVMDMGQHFVPSEHCQYCPAYKNCDAPARLALDLAHEVFSKAGTEDTPADPNIPDPLFGMNANKGGMTDERLIDLLNASVVVMPLMEQAREIARDRIVGGGSIPGWEVTYRKGRRDWTNPDLVLDAMWDIDHDIMPFVLPLSPAQIEKQEPFLYDQIAFLAKQGEPTPVLQLQSRTPRKRSPRQALQPALPASPAASLENAADAERGNDAS